MNRVRFGVVAGLVFGLVDAIPMFALKMPDPGMAITAAFLNRFAIGFLIPNLSIKTAGWLRGLLVGFLVSLPEAIITGVWVPILGIGVAGGAVIGAILGRWETRHAVSK